MQKNTASQKWVVFAFEDEGGSNPGNPVTGDAANITANLRIDGVVNAVDDTNPTEMEDGYYVFDITAAESNGDNILICPESSTANVIVIGVPGAVWTTPANFPDQDIDANGRVDVGSVGGTAQTAGDIVDRLIDIEADTAEIGTNGDGLTALPWNSAWDAEVQSEVEDGIDAKINTTAGAIDNVTLVATTTTNTDMRGTDGANTTAPLDAAGTRSAVGLASANLDTQLSDIETDTDAIQTTLAGTLDANVVSIGGDTDAATAQRDAALGMVRGAAITGTLSTTQMTTDLTEATDDHYIGRVIVFYTGNLAGQATDITDYDGTSKLLTFTALTEAPANGDDFVIV